MSIKLGAFVPLPFDARGWDDAKGAGMTRCEVMHSRSVWPVGPKLERVRRSSAEEESIKHGSPFAVRVYRHWDEDSLPKQQLTDERVA